MTIQQKKFGKGQFGRTNQRHHNLMASQFAATITNDSDAVSKEKSSKLIAVAPKILKFKWCHI